MEDSVNNSNNIQLAVSNDLPNATTHQSEQQPQSLAVVVAAAPTGDANDTVNGNSYSLKYQRDDFDRLPPGLRFCPYDTELITHYLAPKVFGRPLPPSRIVDVKLYKHNPEYLAEKYREFGEKEWYFFTPRNRKYRNGDRPNRAAGDGYWKATGADKPIKTIQGNKTIGSRKALVFYIGKAPRGKKTNWIMHEYRVSDPPEYKKIEKQKKINDDDKDEDKYEEEDDPVMGLDNWVLCRIYKKSNKSVKSGDDGNDDPTPPATTPHHYHPPHHQQQYYDDQQQQDMYDNYNNGLASLPSAAMTLPPSEATYIQAVAPSGYADIEPRISNGNSNNYLVPVEPTLTDLYPEPGSYFIDDVTGMDYNSFSGLVNQLDQQMQFSDNIDGDFSSYPRPPTPTPTPTPPSRQDHH